MTLSGVVILVQSGAMLSLVNKDQATCCELADQNQFKKLADILEVAVLFQPTDELDSMAADNNFAVSLKRYDTKL